MRDGEDDMRFCLEKRTTKKGSLVNEESFNVSSVACLIEYDISYLHAL